MCLYNHCLLLLRKSRMTSYFYCLLLEEVSFMKINWKQKSTKSYQSSRKSATATSPWHLSPMQMQIREQDIPVWWQPHPQLEPALQLHDLMVNNPPFFVSVLRNVSQCQCTVEYESQASCRWGSRAYLLDDSHIHGCSQLWSCMTQCTSARLVLEANPVGLAEGNH